MTNCVPSLKAQKRLGNILHIVTGRNSMPYTFFSTLVCIAAFTEMDQTRQFLESILGTCILFFPQNTNSVLQCTHLPIDVCLCITQKQTQVSKSHIQLCEVPFSLKPVESEILNKLTMDFRNGSNQVVFREYFCCVYTFFHTEDKFRFSIHSFANRCMSVNSSL